MLLRIGIALIGLGVLAGVAGALIWGLDGPVTNRLGLAYAPADRIVIGVLRSNLDDNVELNLKARIFEAELPLLVGVMGGHQGRKLEESLQAELKSDLLAACAGPR